MVKHIDINRPSVVGAGFSILLTSQQMNESPNINENQSTNLSPQNTNNPNVSSSSTATLSEGKTATQLPSEPKPKDYFECNICLDTASEPVLTPCGHLFCWPCIFQWMESDRSMRNACPVCKSGISTSKLIPIYTRSVTKDPRQNIPRRPVPARAPEPTPRPSVVHETEIFNPFPTTTHVFGNVAVSTTFVPSLFGLHFQTLPPSRDAGTQPHGQDQLAHVFLSHLLFILGTLVLLYLFLQ
jgi:hypothetical protein